MVIAGSSGRPMLPRTSAGAGHPCTCSSRPLDLPRRLSFVMCVSSDDIKHSRHVHRLPSRSVGADVTSSGTLPEVDELRSACRGAVSGRPFRFVRSVISLLLLLLPSENCGGADEIRSIHSAAASISNEVRINTRVYSLIG